MCTCHVLCYHVHILSAAYTKHLTYLHSGSAVGHVLILDAEFPCSHPEHCLHLSYIFALLLCRRSCKIYVFSRLPPEHCLHPSYIFALLICRGLRAQVTCCVSVSTAWVPSHIFYIFALLCCRRSLAHTWKTFTHFLHLCTLVLP
jgi:hypothetical protein